MADRCVYSTLKPEIGRNLCLVKVKNWGYRGYKKEILIENFSERENTMFVCIRCQGIMREVCISSGGEQFCSSCKKGSEQIHPNLQMDNMVLSFKCSCPLIARGCNWLGALRSCQNHLDTCGYVQQACKSRCGVVLQRDQLQAHEEEKCLQRIVTCKHCSDNFKFCELSTHLDECPKMEVSCELKCGVIMYRESMPSHIEIECGLVVEMCSLGCEMKLTRDELRLHVADTCVQREIQCEHCKEDFKCCDMSNHLDLCPKIEVSCGLSCGVTVYRDNISHHLEVDCPEKEVECPFAKYKCVGVIKRKDLSKHLEEKRVEHLELKLNAMQDFIMEESEIISKQKEKIGEMSHDIKSLKKEVKNLKEAGILNYIPIKLEWRITKVPDLKLSSSIRKQFQVAGYHLELNFCNAFYHNSLQIRICPLGGWYYEKLKWPFKAEFITRLSSQRNPTDTKEFKSEVFVVKREDFNSDSFIHFTIVTISRDEFLEQYFIDGEAEFEIFVIFL